MSRYISALGFIVAIVGCASAQRVVVPAPDTLSISPADAQSLWRSACAPCHGLKGDLEGVDLSVFKKPPRDWSGIGPSFGFFFGGDKMRAGIYRSIHDGKDQMPAFAEILSSEQIWALVHHIEGL